MGLFVIIFHNVRGGSFRYKVRGCFDLTSIGETNSKVNLGGNFMYFPQ